MKLRNIGPDERERIRQALLRRSPDRLELLRNFAGDDPTYDDIIVMRRFLKALAKTVGSRRKTVLKGLGVFEWHRWKGRTPTVECGESWRLSFQLTRRERKYKGE